MPRLEAHGFTKFILSIGVFLCVAAFVVPALILRDIDVLLVSRHELTGLTPVAASEIRSRQQAARDLGRAAPYLGIVLFLGGTVLVCYGLPRLRRQEAKDEAKASMELDKLQAELKPQSEEEEQAELKATVEETVGEVTPAREVSPPPVEMPSTTSVHRLAHSDRMREVREIQERVLGRLAEAASAPYELRRRVKVAGRPNLLVDGVLVSSVDQLPDILVEIKLVSGAATRNIRNRIADTLLRLMTYRNRLDRRAIGWLIVVFDDPLAATVREQILERADEFRDEIRLTVIEPSEIPQLTLPIGGMGAG